LALLSLKERAALAASLYPITYHGSGRETTAAGGLERRKPGLDAAGKIDIFIAI
jgi:hypothetical protein